MLFFYLQHISWVWSMPQDLPAPIQFFAPEPSPSSLPGPVRLGHLCLEKFLVGLSTEATVLIGYTLFLERLFSISYTFWGPHATMDTASTSVFISSLSSSLFSLSKLKTKHLPRGLASKCLWPFPGSLTFPPTGQISSLEVYRTGRLRGRPHSELLKGLTLGIVGRRE